MSSFFAVSKQAVNKILTFTWYDEGDCNMMKKHRVGGGMWRICGWRKLSVLYISMGSFETRPGCLHILLLLEHHPSRGFQFQFQSLGLGPAASFSLGNGTLSQHLLRNLRRIRRSWHSYLMLMLKGSEKNYVYFGGLGLDWVVVLVVVALL